MSEDRLTRYRVHIEDGFMDFLAEDKQHVLEQFQDAVPEKIITKIDKHEAWIFEDDHWIPIMISNEEYSEKQCCPVCRSEKCIFNEEETNQWLNGDKKNFMRPKPNTKIRAYRTASGLVAIEFEDINGEKETLRFTNEEEAKDFLARSKEIVAFLFYQQLPK